MITKFINSLLGAVVGAVYRPLQHILLTIGLYSILVFTLPIKIFNFMRGAPNGMNRNTSVVGPFIGAALLAPIAILVVSIAAAFTLLGSVTLSPLIGFMKGFAQGLRGAFKATWLSKDLVGFAKRLLPERRARVRRMNMPVYDPPRRAAYQAPLQIVPINPAPPALIPEINQAQPEPENEDAQLQLALRLSEEQFQREILHREYQREQDSLRSVARRAVNLFKGESDITSYTRELVAALEGLQANTQKKIPYLTTEELNQLNAFESQDSTLHEKVKAYQDTLLFSESAYSLSGLHEMMDPVTVEVTLSDGNVHVYYHDHKDLLDHFEKAVLDRIIPEITELRPLRYEGLRAAENNRDLSGRNAKGAQIKIYRGIEAKMQDNLMGKVSELRKILSEVNYPQDPGLNKAPEQSTSRSIMSSLTENHQENAVTPLYNNASTVYSPPLTPRSAAKVKQMMASTMALLQSNSSEATITNGIQAK